jgi:hypothetical protein
MLAHPTDPTIAPQATAPTASRGMIGWLKRHPLTGYSLLAYTGAWLTLTPIVFSKSGVGALPWDTPFPVFAALFILSGFLGPTLAAFVMTGITTGRTGVRLLL